MLICPVCESIYPAGTYDRCPQDGAPLYVFGEGEVKKLFEPGDKVGGKYEIIEEIARRGGAGRTFRARQTNLDREVELRILPADSLIKPGDQARFQREVETWGKLRSDFLVRLYDSGFTEDGAPYMALEYMPGGTLGQRLRIAGPLADAQLRVVAEHALKALDAAHQAGVLHRDISPDALVLGKRADGRPYCRLTGFGLAKLMDDMEDDPTAITMTGQVIGNPAYMAPETMMLGTLEPRTDLYSLGVTLYELASGRRPFVGDSLADLLAAHVRGRRRRCASTGRTWSRPCASSSTGCWSATRRAGSRPRPRPSSRSRTSWPPGPTPTPASRPPPRWPCPAGTGRGRRRPAALAAHHPGRHRSRRHRRRRAGLRPDAPGGRARPDRAATTRNYSKTASTASSLGWTSRPTMDSHVRAAVTASVMAMPRQSSVRPGRWPKAASRSAAPAAIAATRTNRLRACVQASSSVRPRPRPPWATASRARPATPWAIRKSVPKGRGSRTRAARSARLVAPEATKAALASRIRGRARGQARDEHAGAGQRLDGEEHPHGGVAGEGDEVAVARDPQEREGHRRRQAQVQAPQVALQGGVGHRPGTQRARRRALRAGGPQHRHYRDQQRRGVQHLAQAPAARRQARRELCPHDEHDRSEAEQALAHVPAAALQADDQADGGRLGAHRQGLRQQGERLRVDPGEAVGQQEQADRRLSHGPADQAEPGGHQQAAAAGRGEAQGAHRRDDQARGRDDLLGGPAALHRPIHPRPHELQGRGREDRDQQAPEEEAKPAGRHQRQRWRLGSRICRKKAYTSAVFS
ncbi:MAG: protein kinase [bacterium]